MEIDWGYFMGYIMIYWPSNRFVGVTENENKKAQSVATLVGKLLENDEIIPRI
jgi:hypothetical protein